MDDYMNDGHFKDEDDKKDASYKEKGVDESIKNSPKLNSSPQQMQRRHKLRIIAKAVNSKEGDSVDKGVLVEKMKQQNTKLKAEFALLRDKLEECIEKAKNGSKIPDKQILSEEDIGNE
jgi:hypothetical protein